jgi:hypothetical protein
LNRPEASDIQRACGPICPWELLLFNTPKLVVGILAHEDAGPDPMRKWFSDGDLRNEEEALQEALAFIREHKAKSVAIADRIIGCPHEEGPDYPEGEWCPQCPFWKGRDRWSGEREH